MSNGLKLFLLAVGVLVVAALLISPIKASGTLFFVGLGFALIFWNFGKMPMVYGSGLFSGAMVLFWLSMKGAPISQVIALPGLACLTLAPFVWSTRKPLSITLAVFGLGLLLLSQYVRVLLLGL